MPTTHMLRKVLRAKDWIEQISTISSLQSGIQTVSEWMCHNKLKINQEKTEFLIIASKNNQRHVAVDHMVLDGNVINRSEFARNLGVTFDSELNMQKHINEVRQMSIRKYLSLETTKAIVHALIISRLDYCNSLLYHLPLQSLKKLQVVMNAAARLVTLTPRDQSASQALKNCIGY